MLYGIAGSCFILPRPFETSQLNRSRTAYFAYTKGYKLAPRKSSARLAPLFNTLPK